jgi:hypothetical protein
MPIGNIIALGFILSFFGAFMVGLAWGAWQTRQIAKPSRARSTAPARSPYADGGLELAPVRIRR